MSAAKTGGFFRRLFKRFDKSTPDETPDQSPAAEAPEQKPEAPEDTPVADEAAAASAPAEHVEPATRDRAPAAPVEPVEPAGPAEPVEPAPEPATPEPTPPKPSAPKPSAPKPAKPAPEPPAREPVAPVAKPQAPATETEPEKSGWFTRLKTGLSRSSKSLSGGLTDIFTKRKLDDDTLQDLEDILIQADLGLDTAMQITEALSVGRYNKQVSPEEVKQVMADEIAKVLEPVAQPLSFGSGEQPFVILMVGVNGTGKTTTIGKLSSIARSEGFDVTIAACDTFRAAAIEQLRVWGERTGADVVSGAQGADAAGLAFDAFARARENGSDILIIDTAGRLHNKADLMAELDKLVRVLKKQDPNAPHAVLLTLDATTGQNAILQAETFQRVAGVTGIIMTKLDGTARGGILVAIARKFGLPIHAIGVGEAVDDLQPFDPHAFAEAIAGINSNADDRTD